MSTSTSTSTGASLSASETASANQRGRNWSATLVLTMILAWPLLPGLSHDFLNTGILVWQYLIVALSLVLLIGLVGQISLCQSALVGMGAFVGAIATQHLGVRFPFTLLVTAAAGALTAALLGLVALRVRGLYLAVATLIFAYVCDQYLFVQSWLVGSQSGTSIGFDAIGKRGTLPYFDLGNSKVLYYVGLAVGLAALYFIANVHDSRVGRAFGAIRGSEVAAASLGIDVTKFKLLGFAFAGGIAGLAGGFTLVAQRTISPQQFTFTSSLYFLAIAVVGGLRSLGGAIASSILFALLVGEVFFRFPSLGNYLDLISAALLIAFLLFFKGGLGALGAKLRHSLDRVRPHLKRVSDRIESAFKREGAPEEIETTDVKRSRVGDLLRRLPLPSRSGDTASAHAEPDRIDVLAIWKRFTPDAPTSSSNGNGTKPPLPVEQAMPSHVPSLEAMFAADQVAGSADPDGRRSPVLLHARGITVQFGGLTAVRDASIRVGAGEIVGLIGPNGAGKTTLFNSILGLNSPASGTVELYDRDVTEWDVHERAALGVGRTFQILQLFPDLSVFDNLMVATHLQNSSGLWSAMFASAHARRAEREARARVDAVLHLMDLQHVADERVSGLPFGMLRLIEVARTLVTGARLVCFDEPASGLDSGETERLIEWFRLLRQIGVTLLVIEHDVDMVLRLCDYIYVLDQGRLLSDGTPRVIEKDPAVIASYLGTPVEAVS